MLFNSFGFLCFFIPGALIYAALRARHGWRVASQVWLLLLSLAFYSYSSWRELPLLAGSILFNWAMGRLVARDTLAATTRRWLIFGGIAANLIFLGSFKYVSFLLSLLDPLLGITVAAPTWKFPLGISFFTLNQVMYLVDCSEGILAPSSLFDHAAFVAFFPYLVSGPLARAKQMTQQFRSVDARPITAKDVAQGLAFFCIGLFKKTVFADSLLRIADIAYQNPAAASTADAWISVLAYSLQIYFDFSGYSDMAVGLAKMMGFDIPFNFNAPYKSRSIIEFWQRWHISLSNFITTYLYTPILRAFGGRATVSKAAVASILAMTISGLWHGAAWGFVLWGMSHGVALAVNQLWRKKLKVKMPAWLGWAITFTFVTVVEIFFRAPSLPIAGAVLRHLLPSGSDMFHVQAVNNISLETLSYLIPAALALPVALIGRSSQEVVAALEPRGRIAVGYAAMGLYALASMNSIIATSFVYFGF